MNQNEIVSNHYHGAEPKSQHSIAPTASQLRENPLLLRVNADDQDKKSICIFWTVLFVFVVLITVLAAVAIPDTFLLNNRKQSLADTNIPLCDNPSTFDGDLVACQAFSTSQTLGQVIRGWSAPNQFGLVYLDITPNNINSEIIFDQNFTLQLYSIKPTSINTNTDKRIRLKKIQKTDSMSQNFKMSTRDAYKSFSDDGSTHIGYSFLFAIIVDLKGTDLFVTIKFSNASQFSQVSQQKLQTYSVNPKFTAYTIVLRVVLVISSIVTCALYMRRFLMIPQQKRIIEQKMIAVGSVLLIMFNDPFFALTVLKPNGGSAFFSTVFIINMITFLFLLWMVFADRIFFQNGKIETQQLTWKKIVFCVLLWLQLLISMFIYTFQQINKHPLFPFTFQKQFFAAQVIIGITALIAIGYILLRFVKSCCMTQEGKLWRSYTFMVFSGVFIFVIFVIMVSNALMPYSYSGPAILLVYGFINTYVYYLQYMYSITGQELDKIKNNEHQQIVPNNMDMLTVGTIDIVDIDLDNDDYQKDYASRQKKQERFEQRGSEQDSPRNNQDIKKQKKNNKEGDSYDVDFD